ncbi:MAG: phage tail protein [Aeromonas sp.]|uniref:phage tail-collar fiber domain-containing protein n=1 Tax=Aeromonas sp. TaxID=647 RepID=UPI002912DFA5|nr:phage tail protein [Aeromonas sp.]MDU4186991.1 phage tail protein [Aeromonas sp.]
MSQVITNAFEQYWQSSLAAEQPVVLDEFILADIPNLDITSPIDPDAGLPPESQIVHRQNVDQRGRINNNAVAYTIVMDTTVGDFSFNAMYLRNKQNGVIGMIVYKGRETKLKTDQTTGQTGNSLVKSMLMGYDQAAEATLTHVDAGTWQIDYAARLRGQDEDLRQLASHLYGHHTFIGDGFKVVQQAGGHQVTTGVAIVGGLRVELKQPEVIYPGTKPIGVWVDVHRAGSLLSEYQNHFTIITSVADLTDHVDGNGYQHYVAKLGTVLADGTIEDGRGSAGGGGGGAGSIPDTFALWKRSMAEAGFDLIGQFGTENTIENAAQVLLSKDGKKVFAWTGECPFVVFENTDPSTENRFIEVSDVTIRSQLASNKGAELVGLSNGGCVSDAILYATPEMYGAAGDALISNVTPLAAIIGEHTPLTNPNATDDSDAIEQLLAKEQFISFSGGKGYLVSRCFPFTDSNKRIYGHGACIVYRGGRSPGRAITGIFQPNGSFDRNATKAIPKSGVKVFENTILVEKSTNQLGKGDYAVFYAHNGVLDSEFTSKVLKRIYATVQVRRVDEVDSTTQRLHFDYKFGYSWSQSEIQIGTAVVVDNTFIDDFVLIDEMPATPTPDVLPVPEAPSAEKDVAVGLVRGVCPTNSRFTNLKHYKGKYSTVELMGDNNCTVDSVDSFYPVWFGGGEGYAVRIGNSIYNESSKLSMIGGRHVWDLTGGGWCKVRFAHGDTDQVSFSMHTNCEHDIEFEDCTGGDFYLANGGYGLVTNRVKLTRCTFNKVRLNCLHLTLDGCQLSDFEGVCNKATIINTNITEFRFLNKDVRDFSDVIVGEYGEAGKVTIDSASSITRPKDYTSGTSISGWFSAILSNRWKSDPSDSRFSVVMTDVAKLVVNGEFIETNIIHTGLSRSVDLTGVRSLVTNQNVTAAFYAINSMNVPQGEVHRLTMRGMQLNLNGKMRPFQIVGRDDTVQAYNAAVSVGGNIINNGLSGVVSDKAANNKMTLVALAYDKDAYIGGGETQVEARNSSLQYEVGKIYVGKGESGGDAYWNGVSFVSI